MKNLIAAACGMGLAVAAGAAHAATDFSLDFGAYDSNNAPSLSQGVLFDVTVGSLQGGLTGASITLTSLTIAPFGPVAPGATFDLYIHTGTVVGTPACPTTNGALQACVFSSAQGWSGFISAAPDPGSSNFVWQLSTVLSANTTYAFYIAGTNGPLLELSHGSVGDNDLSVVGHYAASNPIPLDPAFVHPFTTSNVLPVGGLTYIPTRCIDQPDVIGCPLHPCGDTNNFCLPVEGGGGVPEPRSWVLAVIGVGAVGASLRLKRRRAVLTIA